MSWVNGTLNDLALTIIDASTTEARRRYIELSIA
jgi:hypothetical protein